jgi:hypothetical protein
MSPDLSDLPPADPRQLDLWGVAHATAGRPAKLMGEDALLFAECYRLGIQIAAIIVAMDVVCGIHLSRFAVWAACRRLDLPRRHGSNAERQERRHHPPTAGWYAVVQRDLCEAKGGSMRAQTVCGTRSPTPTHETCERRTTDRRQVSRQFPNAA